MNKIAVILISLFMTTLANALPDPVETFKEQGDKAYQAEKYEEAIAAYNKIVAQGYESADVYYNLGNAYYKNNQLPYAILNYERAKLLSPSDDDIAYNLQIARQHLTDKIEEVPHPVKDFMLSIMHTASPDGWAWTSLISFLLFLALAGVLLFASPVAVKKLSLLGAFLFLFLSVVTFFFARLSTKQITNHAHAIIVTPTTVVKSSPDDAGADLFYIHEGTKVEITDKLPDWLEIKLADGNVGWVRKDVLVRI